VALLTEENAGVVEAAAGALRRFGRQAVSATPHLLAALKPALVEGRSESSRSLVAALQAVSDNPRQVLCAHFADPELQHLALEALPR